MKIRTTSSIALILAMMVAFSGASAARCNTALLVIDMQNYVFSPLSLFHTIREERELIPAVEDLLVLARTAGLEIMYIRHVAQASPLVDPERLDVVDELEPQEGDAVFTKVDVGAFSHDELGEYLREHGIRRLLLSGLSSQGAVRSTLFAGIREGYDMLVVEDAHSDGSAAIDAKRANNTWRGQEIAVTMMADIDWGAFGCGGDS